MPTPGCRWIWSCRHGKRFIAKACLRRRLLEISIVGTVSASICHHAYGNVHFSGCTVGTLRQFSRHHAYKIFGESRHDEPFGLISCLLFTSRLSQDIGMMKHFGPYHAYYPLHVSHKNRHDKAFRPYHAYGSILLCRIAGSCIAECMILGYGRRD